MFAVQRELPRIPTPTTVIQAAMFAVQQEPPRIPTVPLIHTTLIPTGKPVRFAAKKERHLHIHTVTIVTKPATPVNTRDLSRIPTQIIVIQVAMFVAQIEQSNTLTLTIVTQAVMFVAKHEPHRIPTPTAVTQAAMFAVQQEPPRIPTVLPIHITLTHTGKPVRFAVEKEQHLHIRTVTIVTKPVIPVDTRDL